MEYLRLGASLYVPATRDDLCAIARGDKLAHARSVIFCTEDSVNDKDVPKAVANLAHALVTSQWREDRLCFIRPRNPEVLAELLALPGICNIDGFVLPKLTADNLPVYLQAFESSGQPLSSYWLMPTLETREVFDLREMQRLLNALRQPEVFSRVLALRIGGNDLLNLLGVRRSRYRTLYESPLGPTIANLVALFRPQGFNLSSPVCEFLYDHEVLERELAMDVEYGIFAKTAIHPDQIAIIEQAYRPSEQDVQMAQAILADDAPAVFNMYGTMCEVTTHSAWARQVLARSQLYGVYGKVRKAA